MPVVRFEVKNEYGLADPQLYGAADRGDPEALLEGVAMAGLVGVLRHLGDLAEFAAGIFHNLHEEVMATSARGHSLMLRVQQLEAEFPAVERTFLSQTNQMHAVHNTGIEWHPNTQIDQNLITSGDMPRFILDSYEECRGPPRLFMLDKFDVAGAGACLKRFSDPSFFKMDMTSSGTMEPEIKRERKTRKTKKKLLRLRNGENFKPSPDPHITILNHMQSEKPPRNAPAKRVKLKMRPLNKMDSTKKSYMECVLERYIPNDDVLHENGIKYSPPRTASVDPTASDLEPHVIAVDVSLDGSLPLETMHIQSPVKRGVDGGSTDEGRKEEAMQRTAKLFPIDEVEILPESLKSSGKTEGNDKNVITVEEPVNDISKLKEKVSATDTENRIDCGSDINVSDDIASDADNFMDALATMDSEMETDSDNRPKTLFGLSNADSEKMSEPKEEKKTLSQQILSSDLRESKNVINIDEGESSSLQKSDSPCVSSDSHSFKKEEVRSLTDEDSEVCSIVANKDPLHSSTGEQSFQVDEVHFQAQENSEISAAFALSTKPGSGGEKVLISEQEAGSGQEKALISEEETCSGGEKALISGQESGSVGEKVLISEQETGSDGEKALISEQETGSVGEKVLISEQETCSVGEKILISEQETDSGGEKALISEQESGSGGEKALISEQETDSVGEKDLVSEQWISEQETCSGGEKALISEQETGSVREKVLISERESSLVMKLEVSETESKNIVDSDKFLELPCSLGEPKESSSSSPVICSPSATQSGSQGSGADQPGNANELSQQSSFTPGENSFRKDLANVVSNELFSDNVDGADTAVKYPDGDFKCLQGNFDLPSGLEESMVHDAVNIDIVSESTVHDAVSVDIVSQACLKPLLGAGNSTPITNSKDTQEEHCLEHVVDDTSPIERICTSGDFHDAPSGKDLQSSAVREIEPCHLEKHESDGHPGETETAVANSEDSECSRSKSIEITSSPSAIEIQCSNTEEGGVFSNDAVSSSTKGTLPRSQEVCSNALDNEGESMVLDKDQLHLSSNYPTSATPFSALPTEEHTPIVGLVSKLVDSKDSVVEQHHSPVDTCVAQDSSSLDAAPQKHEPEIDNNLSSLQESKENKEGIGILTQSCDDTIHQEKMLTSSISESLVPNNDFMSEKLDSNCLSSARTDTNETVEHQFNGEQDSVEELFPRKHDISPHLHEEHDDIYTEEPHEVTENPCPGTEGAVVIADQKEPNQQSLISDRDPTDLARTEFQESLDKGQPEMADSQTDAADNVMADYPVNSCKDTPNNIFLDSQSKQIIDVDLGGEMDSRALSLDTDAGLDSESPSNETTEDGASSAAEPLTALTTQFHSEPISCEVSSPCAEGRPSESDSLTETVILGELTTTGASRDLSDPQPAPSILQNSVTDDSNEILEKSASHLSETSCNVSLGEASIHPSSSSSEPSAILIGSTDSDQPLSSSTSNRQVNSEANIVTQPDSVLSMKPLENSPQASLAPVSSLDLPISSPVYTNTLEPSGNALLLNSPVVGPSTLQCDLNATPPLPPLPPLQWRTGKPKVSFQAPTTIASMPLSGSNIFAPPSDEGYLQRHPESVRTRMQGVDAFSQLPAENQSSHYGSMTVREGSLLPSHGHATVIQQAGDESYNSTSVKYQEEDAQTNSFSQDAYDASHCYPKAFQEAILSQKSFAHAPTSSEINFQHSSILDNEQMQLYKQSASLQIPSTEKQQSSTATLQSIQMDLLQRSNPFMGAPLTMDPRYQYSYRLFGGESMQPLATQGIIPHHGFYMPVGENVYGPYSMPLPQMESEKPNGRPNSILNRPRDPLIEAVASHDKSTMRKVSEIVQTSTKPKDDERNVLLDQIKQTSVNLKPTVVTRPNVKGPTTNLKVAAILEKANAMRQACAGSDDEDNWSDS